MMVTVIYSTLMLFSLLAFILIYEPGLFEGLLLAVIISFGMLFGHFDGRETERLRRKKKEAKQ